MTFTSWDALVRLPTVLYLWCSILKPSSIRLKNFPFFFLYTGRFPEIRDPPMGLESLNLRHPVSTLLRRGRLQMPTHAEQEAEQGATFAKFIHTPCLCGSGTAFSRHTGGGQGDHEITVSGATEVQCPSPLRYFWYV